MPFLGRGGGSHLSGGARDEGSVSARAGKSISNKRERRLASKTRKRRRSSDQKMDDGNLKGVREIRRKNERDCSKRKGRGARPAIEVAQGRGGACPL